MTRPAAGCRTHIGNLGRHMPWLPAAIWAYLAVGRGRYWSTSCHLPPLSGPLPHQWPSVAVIVPARNESSLLPRTLPALLAQDYPGNARVVLVDDQSDDATAMSARALAGRPEHRRLGLAVVEGEARPAGWAAKPWAMAQGVAYAMSAPRPPEWLLFTDADIWHPPSSLHQLVASALAGRREGVSLMARLCTQSRWERLTMPAFVYFFAQIYPFGWVNDRRRRAAAAAGGCMLVKVSALERAGGIAAIAAATIDDVALAKALKASGASIWLGLAGNGTDGTTPRVESLRSCPRLADIWEMVARNAYTQLRQSPAILVSTLAAMIAVYMAPPILVGAGLATRRPGVAIAGLSAWTAMAATYMPMARYYAASPASSLALPFTSLLYAAMTVDSARRHRAGGVPWRDRAPH